MPFEPPERESILPKAERLQAGRALRKLVPRSQHGEWVPPPNRADPVDILIETGRHRIARLLPIRYGRMQQSPFAFLRGAAAIMVRDLATSPASGLRVQACGDCHAANFGSYASPEGTPVFDINDFDETLPAPFEWDLKRLAASVAVEARSRNMSDKASRELAWLACQAYRTHMADLTRLTPLNAWRSRIDVAGAIAEITDQRVRTREDRRLATHVEVARRGYPQLLERRAGGLKIRARPPLIFSLADQPDDTHELAARTAFESYRQTLSEDRRLLLDRYHLADVAFKVVGVGSVGTFCAIGLFLTADNESLLLQLKEAQTSVLAPYAGASAYTNQGQRVVTGQRTMQAVSDLFLGWTQDDGSDLQCYVRALKDARLAAVGEEMEDKALPFYAQLCGRTLARAHARSGDAAAIAGYMGSGDVFDSAIADFAMAYAGQTEKDYRQFLAAIKTGRVEVQAA